MTGGGHSDSAGGICHYQRNMDGALPRSALWRFGAIVFPVKLFKRLSLPALLLTAISLPAFSAPESGLQRTGAFNMTATLEQLLGEASAEVQSVIARDEQIDWEVYVPKNYNPDLPAGVMVFVSPSNKGDLPAGWAGVMEDHNLIWVSANKSGNDVPVVNRMLKAIYGLEAVRQLYSIDDSRIYVAGFSGGGKVASRIANNFATTFAGGIFICGSHTWGETKSENVEAIKSNRYVFLTGEFDQALEPTKRAYRSYRAVDVPNIKLVVVRGMGHSNPPGHELKKAIQFLETGENEPI